MTHGQTDFLLSYPDDENSSDAAQEGQFLKEKTESENEIEILAMVDDVAVGGLVKILLSRNGMCHEYIRQS